jgi:hypothetical protein
MVWLRGELYVLVDSFLILALSTRAKVGESKMDGVGEFDTSLSTTIMLNTH